MLELLQGCSKSEQLNLCPSVRGISRSDMLYVAIRIQHSQILVNPHRYTSEVLDRVTVDVTIQLRRQRRQDPIPIDRA